MIQDDVFKQNQQFYDQLIKILIFMKAKDLNFVLNPSGKHKRFTIAEDISILYEDYKKSQFRQLLIEQFARVPPPLQRTKESVKQRKKKLKDATKENLMHILEFLKKQKINVNHFGYQYKKKQFVRLDEKNLYKKGGKGYQRIRQSQTRSNRQNNKSQSSSVQRSLQRNRQSQNRPSLNLQYLNSQSSNSPPIIPQSSNTEQLIPQSLSIAFDQPKNIFKIRTLCKINFEIEEFCHQLIRWKYRETQKFSLYDDLLIIIKIVADFRNLIKFEFCKQKQLKDIQERKEMLKNINLIDLLNIYKLMERKNPNDLQLIIQQGDKLRIIEKEINKKMIVQNKSGQGKDYRQKNVKQEGKLIENKPESGEDYRQKNVKQEEGKIKKEIIKKMIVENKPGSDEDCRQQNVAYQQQEKKQMQLNKIPQLVFIKKKNCKYMVVGQAFFEKYGIKMKFQNKE